MSATALKTGLSICLAGVICLIVSQESQAQPAGTRATRTPTRLPVVVVSPGARFGGHSSSPAHAVYRGTVSTVVANIPKPTSIAYDSDTKQFVVVEVQSWGESVALVSRNGTSTVLDNLQLGDSFTGLAYDQNTKRIYAGVHSDGCRLDAIDPKTGTMTPIAGGTQCGTADGQGAAAQLQGMSGIAVDPTGQLLYVADGDRVRTVTTGGLVTTLTAPGSIGGQCFYTGNPAGIAYDAEDGNLYVADPCPDVIRRVVVSTGQVSTLAGTCINGSFGCQPLDRDGVAARALFAQPTGIAYDSIDHRLYVADDQNNQLRVVTTDAGVSTLAGSGRAEFRDGIGDQASFSNPFGVAILPDGNVYATDSNDGMIRKVITQGPPPPPPAHGVTMMDTPTLGAATWGIARAPDGTIWYSELAPSGGALVHLDQTGKAHVFALPSNLYALDIAADPAGKIWFDAASGPPPYFSFYAIGVKTAHGVTLFRTQLNGDASNVVIGGDGNAWFAEPNASALGTITPDGLVTQFVAQSSSYVGVGPDGDLWTVGLNFIGRYSTAGTLINSYSAALTNGTIGLGPRGDMWFTQPQAIGFVHGSAVATYALPPGPSRFGTWDPMGLAPAPDGSLWFTSNSTGYIGNITTKGLFTPIEVPAPRSAPMRMIEASDGSIWFTDAGSDKIGRWF